MLRLLRSVVRRTLLSMKLSRSKTNSVPFVLLHLQVQKLRPLWVTSAWWRRKKHYLCGWRTQTENMSQLMTVSCARKFWDRAEDFRKGVPKMSDSKLWTVSEGWLRRVRNRFTLKNTKIIGETVSADEAAVIFPAELKKWRRVPWFQAPSEGKDRLVYPSQKLLCMYYRSQHCGIYTSCLSI